MRDSPVSVSAPQTKCCVCFVPLKIFLNFARRTIFRNIEISEYRAFGTLGRPRVNVRAFLAFYLSPLNNVTYKHIGPAETNKQTTQEATRISGPMNRRDSCSINC